MENTISEMKNTPDKIKSRVETAEDQIRELENKAEKTPRQNNKMKKILKKNKDSLRQLQDKMKHNNICIIGIPEGEEEQGTENLFEKVMTENFPNSMRKKVTQVQKAQSITIKMNPESHSKTHHNLNGKM